MSLSPAQHTRSPRHLRSLAQHRIRFALLAPALLVGVFAFSSALAATGDADTLPQPRTLPAPRTADPAAPPDIGRIRASGQLVVAMHRDDYPPFLYTDTSGQAQGIDADLARNLARGLGVTPVLRREATTFDAMVDMVVSHQADIAVTLLSASPARALRVRFSEPYATTHPALLISRQATAGRSKPGNGLVPLTHIGTLRGTAYVVYCQELFPQAQIVLFNNTTALVQAGLSGQVEAIFQSETLLTRLLVADPSLALRLRMHLVRDKTDAIACAVAWEDTGLLAWVNTFLTLEDIPGKSQRDRETFLRRLGAPLDVTGDTTRNTTQKTTRKTTRKTTGDDSPDTAATATERTHDGP